MNTTNTFHLSRSTIVDNQIVTNKVYLAKNASILTEQYATVNVVGEAPDFVWSVNMPMTGILRLQVFLYGGWTPKIVINNPFITGVDYPVRILSNEVTPSVVNTGVSLVVNGPGQIQLDYTNPGPQTDIWYILVGHK